MLHDVTRASTMQHTPEGPVDFAFLGLGVAALCLRRTLAQAMPPHRTFAVDPEEEPDHNTYGFWAEGPTALDDVVERSWDVLRVASPAGLLELPLGSHRYHAFSLGALRRKAPAGPTLRGRVEEETPTGFLCDGVEHTARFVCDSRPPAAPDDAAHVVLRQTFLGIHVTTSHDTFSDDAATLMDFRTPQDGPGFTFGYVLPFSRRRAMVETVRVSAEKAAPPSPEAYLRDVLGVHEAAVVHQEGGTTIMTDAPFLRRAAENRLLIGLAGGRLKPSTGYAVTRILRDSEAIARSLVTHGHPFDLPDDPTRYGVLDRTMLRVMRDHPDEIPGVMGALFGNNPVDVVLRFLDERASRTEMLRIMSSLPARRFVGAFVG